MPDNGSMLLKDAETFVTDLFQNKVSKSLQFHTLRHTQEVVAACDRMATFYHLPEEDRLAVLVAAWFHDTGYSGGQAKDHETISAQLAGEFLTAHQASTELTGKVMGCINATRMPQNPSNTLEKIICDADLFHLGTDAFKEKNNLLREELKTFGGEDIPKKEWWKKNIQFLEAHHYFTSYAQENLQPVKEVHIKSLKARLNAEEAGDDKKKKDKKKKDSVILAELQVDDDKKKNKSKDNQTERGISTVFRIMAQTQNNLSQMADSKANILISVNSIILSIVLSQLSTKLQNNPSLLAPVIMLVCVCVTVIVFSILATRPTISHGTFTQEDVQNKKANLLFFGNFYKMSLHDYDWAMMEMLNDKNYLYSSVVKDSYFLGVVLAKKYRFLRIAYNIFMYGLIITMIAFAVTIAITSAGTQTYEAG